VRGNALRCIFMTSTCPIRRWSRNRAEC
jgi:hypothetical protein